MRPRHRRRSCVVIAAFSGWVLSRGAQPGTLLSPPLIALLLIANLIPAIALMVLFSRKMAMGRAAAGRVGSGRLHTRLVALVFGHRRGADRAGRDLRLVAVPERARILVLRPRPRDAREYRAGRPVDVRYEVERVADETVDRERRPAGYLRADHDRRSAIPEAFGRKQVLNRNLSEAIIFTYGPDKQIRTLALVDPYDRPLEKVIPPAAVES